MRILTLLFVCLLLPSAAMATVFTPPATDKSVELLGVIFGTHMGPIFLGGVPNPALMRMFELFNVIIISIGTVIVSYIGLVSTVNTAQEGKTMGKKWSSIWIPLRATLGMLMIVPTPTSGYSVVQTTVMWLILQGVGAADQIWNGILADLGSGLSINRAVQTPDEAPIKIELLRQGSILTGQLLRSAVCKETLNRIATTTANNNSLIGKHGKLVDWYVVTAKNNLLTPDEATYAGVLYAGKRGHEKFNDVCGKYEVVATVNRNEWDNPAMVTAKDLDLKAKEIYEHKQLAMHLMLSKLLPLARQIVDEAVQPRGADNNRLIAPLDDNYQIIPAGVRQSSINAYTQIMLSLVKPRMVNELQEVVRQGSRHGWISAGAFYFSLNHGTNDRYFDSVVAAPVAAEIPLCDNLPWCSEHLPADAEVFNEKLRSIFEYDADKSLLATRLWDAKIYLDNDRVIIEKQINISTEVGPQPFDNLQRDMLQLITELMNKDDIDPLIAQGKFGTELMIYTENSWLKNIEESRHLENEAAQYDILPKEIREKISDIHTVGMLNISVYGILWIVGATLSIYVPLIPYMIFTVAVVGWFLLVIEAIVAAPILALGFILPSGEELGKVMQGLMLLLNILLRPTLMLFGFILASRLYKAMIQLVNFSMLGNFDNLETSSSYFAWVAVITIYCAFIIALSNKCFALIYALPDKVLRWMGGGPEHTDASQELQQAKGTMSKGADTANKISSGFGEREFARLQSRANQHSGLPADDVRGGNRPKDE